jgi:hypothetical protein
MGPKVDATIALSIHIADAMRWSANKFASSTVAAPASTPFNILATVDGTACMRAFFGQTDFGNWGSCNEGAAA